MFRGSLIALSLFSLFSLVACGGVHREFHYRPFISRHLVDEKTEIRESYNYLIIDVGDVELVISPVKLSSKLTWIIGPAIIVPSLWEEEVHNKGPLEIAIFVKVKSDSSVIFDPAEFVVVSNDMDFPPESIKIYPEKDYKGINIVKLRGEGRWNGKLKYGLEVESLPPFVLNPGKLNINGKEYQFPPITFKREKSYHSS